MTNVRLMYDIINDVGDTSLKECSMTNVRLMYDIINDVGDYITKGV